MDEQDWMRRIDRHLEASEDHMRRGNEIMARSNEVMARSSEVMARSNEVMARNERAFLDLQSYLREATAMLGALTAEILEGRREFVEENRAQRRALFAILDRLEGRPPPSPA